MIHITLNLTDQQVCFCNEYLVNFNAYRSAISAGYSENTARKGELLHMTKIQEYLRLKMQQRAERLEITHDMILREYAKIAFSNMGNYYDEHGDLKPMCELTETEKAAIHQCQTMNIADNDGYRVGTITKIKLHNKMAALDKIAKHLGFFNQAQESTGKDQDARPDAGSLKQEAFFENQELMCEDQDDEGLVVNCDENPDAEVKEASAVAQINDAGVLHSSSSTAGKNLTLSPLTDAFAVLDNVIYERMAVV